MTHKWKFCQTTRTLIFILEGVKIFPGKFVIRAQNSRKSLKSYWGLHWGRGAVLHHPSKDKGLDILGLKWACYYLKGRNRWGWWELSWILGIAHSFVILYPYEGKFFFWFAKLYTCNKNFHSNSESEIYSKKLFFHWFAKSCR